MPRVPAVSHRVAVAGYLDGPLVRLARALKLSVIAFAFGVVIVGGAFYFYSITQRSSTPVGSAQNLVDRADTLATNGR
jgi:hypothetical protein